MVEPSITCPRCGRTSYNQHDIREGFCGLCHNFTSVDVATRNVLANAWAMGLTWIAVNSVKQAYASRSMRGLCLAKLIGNLEALLREETLTSGVDAVQIDPDFLRSFLEGLGPLGEDPSRPST